MIGYKVCHIKDNRMYSAMDLGKRLEYFIGKETNRPEDCGPMGVFTNFDAAATWAICWALEPYGIFKCNYEPSESESLWYVDQEGNWFSQDILPINAVLADKITLLEKV